MSRLDDEITKALAEEERDLMLGLGNEPTYLSQMKSNFIGPGGWTFTLSYIANIVFFSLFVIAGFQVATADTALLAIQWAVGCLSALVLSVYFKASLSHRHETNRLLRELRLLYTELMKRKNS